MILVDNTGHYTYAYRVRYSTTSGTIVIYSNNWDQTSTDCVDTTWSRDQTSLTITQASHNQTLYLPGNEKEPPTFKSIKQQYLEYLENIIYLQIAILNNFGDNLCRTHSIILHIPNYPNFWARAPPCTISIGFPPNPLNFKLRQLRTKKVNIWKLTSSPP